MLDYPPPLQQIPPHICSLEDYRREAQARLSEPVWAYIDSGSGDQRSLQRNRQAFNQYGIWSRVLQAVQQGHSRTTLLGQTLPHPIMLAPVAHQKLLHPDGELATAEAADATDTAMMVSTLASQPLAEIAARSRSPLWFQLYWQGQRQRSLQLLQQAEQAGFSAIVITLDVPINGLRRQIQRSGFVMPIEAAAVNVAGELQPPAINAGESAVFQGWMATAPQWDDIAWLIEQSPLPVVLKGILHPADSLRAQQLGAAAVILSNHGGRALDEVPAAFEVLPQHRQQLGNDYPLLIDGGIRQGSDVFKALALGANAVLLGRPQLYGLAVAGALGVAHQIQLLRQELEVTMALAGCATLEQITPECLYQQSTLNSDLD